MGAPGWVLPGPRDEGPGGEAFKKQIRRRFTHAPTLPGRDVGEGKKKLKKKYSTRF